MFFLCDILDKALYSMGLNQEEWYSSVPNRDLAVLYIKLQIKWWSQVRTWMDLKAILALPDF